MAQYPSCGTFARYLASPYLVFPRRIVMIEYAIPLFIARLWKIWKNENGKKGNLLIVMLISVSGTRTLFLIFSPFLSSI
jgi:hypothetical protein